MTPRARDAALFVGGCAALAVSGALARRPGVSDAEERAFRALNDLPDRLSPLLRTVMQGGTFGVVPAAAAVAALARRRRLAATLAVSGTAAYVLGKIVKRPVGRPRPAALLPNVRLRGREEGDLGFPSGHAAVSAALTIAVWPHTDDRYRLAGLMLAGFVPFARMYVGAHLPLDALGGSALGIAVGCLANLAGPK